MFPFVLENILAWMIKYMVFLTMDLTPFSSVVLHKMALDIMKLIAQ